MAQPWVYHWENWVLGFYLGLIVSGFRHFLVEAFRIAETDLKMSGSKHVAACGYRWLGVDTVS